MYGPLSTGILVAWPRLRRMPVAWCVDFAAGLGLILASGDWRSPYYLLWLTTLALPAVSVPLRQAVLLAFGATLAFLAVAIVGGPVPGRVQVISAETLGIHVSLPFLLVCALAYAADAMRRLGRERAARERLAIESERRRIAWELHDSAKQRLHAAHLLVSSLQGRVPASLERTVSRASVELESAASDMDTSLAELRSPLEGRPLEIALRERATELAPAAQPVIEVAGEAPELTPLVAAHVYRIACEAVTNALRHADAMTIRVAIGTLDGHLRLTVTDDGRGMPEEPRTAATGLFAMRSRAATIGARLDVSPVPGGRGTLIELDVPLSLNGGPT